MSSSSKPDNLTTHPTPSPSPALTSLPPWLREISWLTTTNGLSLFRARRTRQCRPAKTLRLNGLMLVCGAKFRRWRGCRLSRASRKALRVLFCKTLRWCCRRATLLHTRFFSCLEDGQNTSNTELAVRLRQSLGFLPLLSGFFLWAINV